jgi:RNA polymerase sigma-70 factor (ECF subfamily)
MQRELVSQITAPVPEGDEALVRRLRDGQTAAGEVLVHRHCGALMRYLQRMVGSDHLAEELHQQTWASVLENLERFDPSLGGGFKAWLYRIATNKANDHWRSRGREKTAKDGLRLITDDLVPQSGQGLETTEELSKLRAAIDLLPASQRQVVLLRYYSNLKFVQIAQILGCPLNTALGRMHKAMLRLKEIMSQEARGASRAS